MSARDSIVCIEGLRAVVVTGAEGRATFTADIPPGLGGEGPIERRDSAAIGAWLSEMWRSSAGGSPGAVSLALPRAELALKWLAIPAGLRDPIEQSQLVRLQMSKQLGAGLSDAGDGGASHAIDHRVFPPSGDAEATPSTALVAAWPADRRAATVAILEAAGLKLRHAYVRAEGIAAALRPGAARWSTPVLGIFPGHGVTEMIVLHHGRLVAARSVDLDLWSDPEVPTELSSRLLIEARRTLAGEQASAGAEAVLVLGAGAMPRRVAELCASGLSMHAEAIPPSNATDDPQQAEAATLAAPLQALMAPDADEMLDVVGRKPPQDPRAVGRRRVVMAAAAMLVLAAMGWLLMKRDLDARQEAINEVLSRRSALAQKYNAMQLDDAKTKHIEQWLAGGRFNWLAHLRWLSDEASSIMVAKGGPSASQERRLPGIILDEFKGVVSAPVGFASKDGSYGSGVWSAKPRGVFTITGTTRQREAANDLRDRFVVSQVYGVESKGADVEDRFVFELTTSQATPVRVQGPPQPKTGDGSAAKEGAR